MWTTFISYEPQNNFRRYNLCRVAILNPDARASERRGGYDADTNDEDAHARHEEHRREEEIDKEKHEDDDARRCSSELAWQAEVVGGSGHGVDVPAGRVVQKGRCDDCQEPGLEEGFAEGAIVGDADVDILCESRGQEPVEEPAARAGACKGASARADREDEEHWPNPRFAA
jgi:hypothetical protein